MKDQNAVHNKKKLNSLDTQFFNYTFRRADDNGYQPFH